MTDLKTYRDLFDLSGRDALVIGAGSGIGKAGAEALAAFGADVICADLDEDAAATTAAGIVADGGSASSGPVDIGERESVAAIVAEPDIVVSTPAINVRKTMLSLSDEEFRRVIDLNLRGTFNVLTTAGAGMADRGRGSIIVISSIRSQVVEPGQGVYAATKAGVLQLVKTLAAELGPQRVRVNALAPGVVETPLTEQIKSNPEWYEAYASKSALGRWSQPVEMAGPIVYLASEAASFVTGSLLIADGGWLAIDGRFTPPL
jgi:NAD(P)-dependent dehydrogenase (short-subunit alcohol dehydrogenase family)